MRRNCAKSPTNRPVYRIAFLTLWKKGVYQCYLKRQIILNCSNPRLRHWFFSHCFMNARIEQFSESSAPSSEAKPNCDLCYLSRISTNTFKFSNKAGFPDLAIPCIGKQAFQGSEPKTFRFPESTFWNKNKLFYFSFPHFCRSGFCRSRNQWTIISM